MIKPRVVLTFLVASIGVTCRADDPISQTPANVSSVLFSLTTPNADDGAVLVTVRGPGLATVQSAAPAYLVFSNVVTAQEARVIVVGDLVAGSLFSVTVGGTHTLADYSVAVEQVSTRADALRSSLAGYRLTLAAGP